MSSNLNLTSQEIYDPMIHVVFASNIYSYLLSSGWSMHLPLIPSSIELVAVQPWNNFAFASVVSRGLQPSQPPFRPQI